MPQADRNDSQTDAKGAISMRPDELRVGMYVDLNCSWFKHPFPLKSFTITSESQLATIRGLGLTTVLVYPSHSEAAAQDGPPGPAPSLRPASDGQSPAGQGPRPSGADYHEAVNLTTHAYHQVIQRSTQMMRDLCNGSAEGLSNAKAMINGISTLITNTEAASTVASLFDAEELDNVRVLHALNVSTLAMMVARHFNIGESDLRLIGMAGLLHDIGEQRVAVRIVRNRSRLSRVEALEYHRHTQYAVDMLKQFPGFPTEVLNIIRQHHERLDGSGYPAKLKGDQIPLPTRIVSAVDQYDTLINNPEADQVVSPAEALAHLYKNQKHLFAAEVLVAMIQTLGVYPPGTVVALTDGTIGLVLNINFESRLKPLILAYEPDRPQNGPHIIDLCHDTQRSILRGISKQEIPRDITGYLQLKRWTGYFIQSSIRSMHEETAA